MFYHVEPLPEYVSQALLNPELPVPKDDPAGLREPELPAQDLAPLLLLLLLPNAFMMLPLLQLPLPPLTPFP